MKIGFVLIGLLAIFLTAWVFYQLWQIVTFPFRWKSKRNHMQSALAAEKEEREKRNAVWKEAEAIQQTVNLYMQMVAKHGPSSDEAKAFRFGTEMPLMKQLHQDDAALESFNQQADIIDMTYRRMQEARRWR